MAENESDLTNEPANEQANEPNHEEEVNANGQSQEHAPEPSREPTLEEVEEISMAEAMAQFEAEQHGKDAEAQPHAAAPAVPETPAEPAAAAPAPGEPAHGHPQQRPHSGQRHDHPPRGHRGGNERRSDRRPDSGHERRQDRGQAKPHQVKVEILANTSFEETRIAVLEDSRLVELLWERKSAQSIVGNIYKGVIENVLPGISSAFINIGFEKNAYLYISDVIGDTRQPIDHILKKGQQVMVQVAKEAIGTKGMKVTMDVALPGRFLVLTPMHKEVGISKSIEESAERNRLTAIIDKLAAEVLEGKGVVVRTEAEGASETALVREAKYLLRMWEAIQRRYESGPQSCLLHKDLDLTMQIARDMLTDETYVYLLDNKEEYHNVQDFTAKISPELKDRVRYYDGKTPIFSAFNIEPEIEKLRQIKVPLPSGGTIVVQEAESLCAIDVNTGRFTGSKSQEETVTMTNIEAAEEIAHQLRLRNIGGIVVIDFIDMKRASNRNRVMEALAEAVSRDRAKIRILPITRLGLIEMTRERKRESTVSLMTGECPECHGAGRVLSAESLRIRIQREIHDLTQGRPGGQIRVQLHPQLADAFKERQSVIEKNVHRSVKIQADPMLSWEDYRIILE